jgi:membrane fusion protein, multidrug efflux system
VRESRREEPLTADHSGPNHALDPDDTSPVGAGEKESEPRRPRRWPIIVVVAVVALVAAVLVSRSGKKSAAAAAASARAGAPIPVVVAESKVEDLPVYLTGLGTVTPLNTVTVRSRVDGQLLRVAYKEGQLVKEGDLLAEIDPRPFQVQLTQAEGQLAKDQAGLANSKTELARFQNLYDQQLLSKEQLDSQVAMVAQEEAAIRADQGAVDAAKLNITYSKITSPISGRTGLRLVDPGNIVHAADATGIVVLTQTEPIAVLFTIPQDNLPQVAQRLKAGAKLPAEARDRDLTKTLAQGELLTIDNQIDPATGTVRLKAVFSNKDGGLFPQQFVNVRLRVDTLSKATVVPSAALQRSPQSSFVYVVGPNQTVEMRPVEVRLVEADTAAISKGLSPGETVVIDGLDKLQEGSKVAPRSAGTGAAPKARA